MTKAHDSVPVLGVPEMDNDHLAIEALFVSAGKTADDKLPALLDRIAQELEDHFRREETLLAQRHVPLADCHKAQHRMILHEVEAMRKIAGHAEAGALRRLMEVALWQMVSAHVASVDRVAAAFLTGQAGDAHFNGFRLPDPKATISRS